GHTPPLPNPRSDKRQYILQFYRGPSSEAVGQVNCVRNLRIIAKFSCYKTHLYYKASQRRFCVLQLHQPCFPKFQVPWLPLCHLTLRCGKLLVAAPSGIFVSKRRTCNLLFAAHSAGILTCP